MDDLLDIFIRARQLHIVAGLMVSEESSPDDKEIICTLVMELSEKLCRGINKIESNYRVQ